ncbi:hypothetical protein H9W91_07200 [Streptomyces alfalfae]|uniref:hypothetical protein n=1 Tax=Streptomyces alfalfae TaxID=1642299 RepID=UPI001BAE10BA|nr:hypothetical protein [Streptomyces alfalfae]QUI30671.1 hypothetical protein H9W91_07200 [Streptomyces alfalfae]
MAKLPPNHILKALHLQGLSDQQIADQYGVKRQAVNKRLRAMDIEQKPEEAQAAFEMLPWQVKTLQYGQGTHHTAYPYESLKLYLRALLGDETLTNRQRADAARFERRLLAHPGKVLVYDRDTEKGFSWQDREPADGSLIIRWPTDVPKPDKGMELLELPTKPKLNTPAS